ncbi:hypothetical protein BHQ29_09215 [Pseudomonas sp. LPH1]|nr:hypothetical protein BHQ29_09215 [Pseudomonas sp. LPH1]
MPSALKEWQKLGHTVPGQIKKRNCASAWIIPRFICRGKIKLLASGCLLVCRVEDERVVVVVVAVGKRERGAAYQSAKDR